MNIRGKTIRFSAKEKKGPNIKEEHLIQEIEYLETNPTLRNLNQLIEDKNLNCKK